MNPVPVHPHAAKPALVRLLLSRPRLFLCIAVGIATVFLLPIEVAHQTITRALIGWNAGACSYIVLAMLMMFSSTHERT